MFTAENNEKVDEFLTRSIENVFPNKEALKAKLLSGQKLTFYYGIDPTGPSIHAGHLVPLLSLMRLQKLGHKIIFLIGDFTAMIGDPTDKTATRKPLTKNEVQKNLKNYKKQVSSIIKFSGKNKAEVKFNSKWLSKLRFADVLDIASKTTVDQMLKRDMFARRSEQGKPIHLHEFLYPLMQGYDSVAMNVDGEVGGNDQTFNMLAGRDLIKIYKNKEKFVVATKLLTDQAGKKMGKTEGNMISLDESPDNVFGKIMSWPDTIIVSAMECLTTIPMQEINQTKTNIERGANPKQEKIKLAKAVVGLCFGEKEATYAAEKFQKTFSNKEMPDDTSVIEISTEDSTVDVLVSRGIIDSKSEARRLADAGAITNFDTGEKISFDKLKTTRNTNIRVGKHRFVKIK